MGLEVGEVLYLFNKDEYSDNILSFVRMVSGNIDTDPCFVTFDIDGDPKMWDFHLQSSYGRLEADSQNWVIDSNTSPCIDAGNPSSDWNDEPWPNGKRINMGSIIRPPF